MSSELVGEIRRLYFECKLKVSDILELYKGRLTYADIKKIIGG